MIGRQANSSQCVWCCIHITVNLYVFVVCSGLCMTHRGTVEGKQTKLAPRHEHVWRNENTVPHTLDGRVQLHASTALSLQEDPDTN